MVKRPTGRATRAVKSRDRLEALLQEATDKERSYANFLDQVLPEEVASKTAKHVTMRTQLARFPFVKGLDAFDFSYQPSLAKMQVQTLSTCHFIEHEENRGSPPCQRMVETTAFETPNVTSCLPAPAFQTANRIAEVEFLERDTDASPAAPSAI